MIADRGQSSNNLTSKYIGAVYYSHRHTLRIYGWILISNLYGGSGAPPPNIIILITVTVLTALECEREVHEAGTRARRLPARCCCCWRSLKVSNCNSVFFYLIWLFFGSAPYLTLFFFAVSIFNSGELKHVFSYLCIFFIFFLFYYLP